MKVAVIGGGFTGLTAAYELSKNDFDITIFEKSDELGGLASGFSLHGESIEKTYHHIFKTDTDIISLVKELGLSKKLEWRDSSVCIHYNGKNYPFSCAIDLLKFKPISFVSRIRQGIVIFYLQKEKSWKKFVNISAHDWMRKFCGSEAMKVIWEPLLKGKFNKFYDRVSMAWLWARLHIRANSRKFVEGEKLGYFDGGFNIIIKELEKRLSQSKVQVETKVEVSKIYNKDTKVEVVFKKEGREIIRVFDKIVCTLPSHVFANLVKNNAHVSQKYFNKLKSIDYLGAICLVFSSEQNLSDYYWHNINDPEFPFLVFIHHTKLIPKERYSGKYIYYIGAYLPHESDEFSVTDEELIKKWFDYLKKMFPNFDISKVIYKKLFRFGNAQHIVDLDYESKIPGNRTPIPNVYLANFSQIFPEDRGTNFSVREGRKIAKLIINDMMN